MEDPKACRARGPRFRLRHLGPLLVLPIAAAGCGGEGDACALEDADGIIGGQKGLEVRITDDGFEPIVLEAQNQMDITLEVINESSGEAGFMVDCLSTPNDEGCPQESCFPDAADLDPIPPGDSATIMFQVPEVEGEYIYRALPDDDERTGQFILL